MASKVTAPTVRVRKTERVQSAIESVNARKRIPIESSAVSLIVSYSSDLAYRILEDSAVLAKHRGAQEIDAADVNLTLMKKYNIIMPPIDGVHRVTLHKETLPSSYSALNYSILNAASATSAGEKREAEGPSEGTDTVNTEESKTVGNKKKRAKKN